MSVDYFESADIELRYADLSGNWGSDQVAKRALLCEATRERIEEILPGSTVAIGCETPVHVLQGGGKIGYSVLGRPSCDQKGS